MTTSSSSGIGYMSTMRYKCETCSLPACRLGTARPCLPISASPTGKHDRTRIPSDPQSLHDSPHVSSVDPCEQAHASYPSTSSPVHQRFIHLSNNGPTIDSLGLKTNCCSNCANSKMFSDFPLSMLTLVKNVLIISITLGISVLS